MPESREALDPGGRFAPRSGTEPAPKGSPATLESIATICPYLMAEGGWRGAQAMSEHRCTAVDPPEPLAFGTQRTLCLTESHTFCSAYEAAAGRRREHLAASGILVERVEQSRVAAAARPVPVALDRPRRVAASARLAALTRSAAGAGLALIALLALATVVMARLVPNGSGATDAPAAAVPGAVATATPRPTASAETPSTPSPAATAAPTWRPSDSPSPTPAPRTYTVQSGDTLSGIAAEFDTTVAELARLNGIEDPSAIQIGQELVLP